MPLYTVYTTATIDLTYTVEAASAEAASAKVMATTQKEPDTKDIDWSTEEVCDVIKQKA